VVVDMTITSLKNIVEQFEVFESIVEFLFDVRTLKSLDNDINYKKFKQILRLRFLIRICRMLTQMIFCTY